MAEEFKHPLARGACLRPAYSLNGTQRVVLVIVTTLQLEPIRKGYKKFLVEKLSQAAKEYLANMPNAKGFVLINRLRNWGT